MSETWRVKHYYIPRVIISTQDVLECPYPDSMVCLTGAQLVMLRNLTQYLHRRSTFASEYRKSDYLAPSNAEWDALETVVADLEENLMGCPEIVAKLQCICDAILALQTIDDLPVDSVLPGQPLHDDYVSPVVGGHGDPPPGWETWSAWDVQKCKAAQKLFDDVVEVMQKIAVVAAYGGVVTVVALLATFVLSAIVPPLAIVALAATALATLGITAIQSEAQQWIELHKQNLVCCVFDAPNAAAARIALESYIDANWDIGGSPAVLLYMLNYYVLSNVFDGTMPGYANWEGMYSAAYCESCVPPLCIGDPVIGSDWWACARNDWVSLPGASMDDCLCYSDFIVPAGQRLVGFVSDFTGANFRRRNCTSCTDCPTPCVTFDKMVESLAPGAYVMLDAGFVNNAEVQATLYPTATLDVDNINNVVGSAEPSACFCLQGSGNIEWNVVYWVFEGTNPPS